MKKIFLFIAFAVIISCKSQTYPLRTYGIDYPKDSYVKDINNELQSYEGMWKGSWNNKTFFISFKKIKYYKSFLDSRSYYADILVGKFKILDNNGNIIFDNTSSIDDKSKIKGSDFRKKDNKYSLSYLDMELCGRNGYVTIQFTDATKTKLEWKFSEGDVMIDSGCFYHDQTWPETLPKNVILTKQ